MGRGLCPTMELPAGRKPERKRQPCWPRFSAEDLAAFRAGDEPHSQKLSLRLGGASTSITRLHRVVRTRPYKGKYKRNAVSVRRLAAPPSPRGPDPHRGKRQATAGGRAGSFRPGASSRGYAKSVQFCQRRGTSLIRRTTKREISAASGVHDWPGERRCRVLTPFTRSVG